MIRRTCRPALYVAILTLGSLALAACSAAPTGTVGSPAPASSSNPTPSASPSASATPLPVLFTVSARVRSVEGTSIDISLIGHPPLTSTDPGAKSLVTRFLAACTEQNGVSVSDNLTPVSNDSLKQFGSSLMRLDFLSTPVGATYASPVDLALGSDYFAEIATGDTVQPTTSTPTCTGGYQVTGSAPAVAVANFETGTATPDINQWVNGHYGFSVPFQSGATIEACTVVISDGAKAAIGETPGWEPGSDSTGISCGIGYRGE